MNNEFPAVAMLMNVGNHQANIYLNTTSTDNIYEFKNTNSEASGVDFPYSSAYLHGTAGLRFFSF